MVFLYMRKHKNFYIVIFSLLIIFVMSLLGIYKCPSDYVLGIPCPTCGITRALGSLLLLDINKSFYYHALWPLVIIGLFIYIFNEFDIIVDCIYGTGFKGKLKDNIKEIIKRIMRRNIECIIDFLKH